MYRQLQVWHDRHKSALSIMLYPSDEFGGQELPAAQIPGFVAQYLPPEHADVHVMAKGSVNGPRAAEVWRAIKEVFPGDVGWNFDAIVLLDQEGVPVGRYTARQLRHVDADLTFLLTQSGWL